MNKFTFAALLVAAFSFQASAQSESAPVAKHNKIIFVEALGNGIGLSANFDMRFQKGTQEGFGFRAGLGGSYLGSANNDAENKAMGIVTLPLSVNYLVGENRSAFEAGLGITPMYARMDVYSPTKPRLADENGWGATGFLNLGYRFQPLGNGFVFRANWTPAFNSAGFSPSWFGLSVGYGFK
ncbi:hypothetical protein ACXYMU_15495 [Pontibacter sp. CAU 1760]